LARSCPSGQRCVSLMRPHGHHHLPLASSVKSHAPDPSVRQPPSLA
jgi:hypothetical protein